MATVEVDNLAINLSIYYFIMHSFNLRMSSEIRQFSRFVSSLNANLQFVHRLQIPFYWLWYCVDDLSIILPELWRRSSQSAGIYNGEI